MAQLPRLHWVAGTRCAVALHVENGSKKIIRSLLLTLVRTTTLFRPRPMLDADGDRDPDACQTATTHKAVEEVLLEMGESVAKGRASAKGWWTGIAPGQDMQFSHYIVLPVCIFPTDNETRLTDGLSRFQPDSLSVTRSRLLEVEYSIRVTLSAGPLTSDVSVTLPIRIINFLSIDPPPSAGLSSSVGRFPDSRAAHALDPSISTSAIYSRSPDPSEPDEYPTSRSFASSLHVMNPDPEAPLPPVPRSLGRRAFYPHPHPHPHSRIPPAESEISMSMYSSESATGSDADMDMRVSASRVLSGVLELDEDAGDEEEIAAVLRSVRVNEGHFGFAPLPTTSERVRGRLRERQRQGQGQGRMEGVGTGMTGFARRVQEKKRVRAQRLSDASVSSASEADVEVEEETEETPRLGTHVRHAATDYYSGDVDADADISRSRESDADVSTESMEADEEGRLSQLPPARLAPAPAPADRRWW